MIAALYVETGGVYCGLPHVDPWDEARDARKYAGPWPVVAHPPCARWGRYYGGSPTIFPRLKKGDDNGCFASALASVRRFGGVLEHPEGSHARRAFELNTPPRCGGWVAADWQGGWTCCIEQGWYGHKARKATWLYASGIELPALRWGAAPGDFLKIDDGFHTAEERRRAVKTGACKQLSHRQRAATPSEFRDLLIAMAQSASKRAAACPLDERPMTAPRNPHSAAEDEANLNLTASHPRRRHSWPMNPTRVTSELTIRTCERCGLVWHSRHDWTTSNGPSHWSEFYTESNPEVKLSRRPECAP